MKNRVSKFRAKFDMSQKDLAEKCNVSRQTIHSIESSKYKPSVTLALKIARILKVKIEDLFSLEKGD